jgi:hypothetical protein
MQIQTRATRSPRSFIHIPRLLHQVAMDIRPSRKVPADLDLTSIAFQEKNHEIRESTGSDVSLSMPFNDAATKRLLRKLDLHLIPFLAVIYL